MLCIEFRIVAIQPHAAAGGDAAQFQFQSCFAQQALLRRAQLGKQYAADAPGADQADGQRSSSRHGSLQRRQTVGMFSDE
ncbi:hypothetical protein GCM10010981_16000 [Dyella nitratireducens]|uniref:Uncharacterized protein n=1 Tax=Dyella nitratireducens TaxID=1849580 RepID=A0ABQ1FTN0_9GAMM|nr:hypothetical protein GCM10010981_16000 [Dyella nitratireducens]